MSRKPISFDKACKIVANVKLHGVNNTARNFNMKISSVERRLREIKKLFNMTPEAYTGRPQEPKDPRVLQCPIIPDESFLGIENILIIGDLHAPFIKKGYLEFCKHIYKKHNCNRVIFIGDIIDMHYSSYHETDPDGVGAGQELEMAINDLKKWHNAFPVAQVCFGNHDIIASRKAFSAGLSKRWIKTIEDILGFDGWVYGEEFIINEVKYVHGTGRKARNRAKDDFISVVQGHYHSESYIEHLVGERSRFFAMQIGCGVCRDFYSMAYGKHFKKMHVNCGVVLENGELPFLEYMKL